MSWKSGWPLAFVGRRPLQVVHEHGHGRVHDVGDRGHGRGRGRGSLPGLSLASRLPAPPKNGTQIG